MPHVSIIGLGLIGASIGLGLRHRANDSDLRESPLEIRGFDLNPDHQSYAKRINAVDRIEPTLTSAIHQSDFIVIATPVYAVPGIFEAVAQHGRPQVIVSDTSSTKATVMRWASESLPESVQFIGGHPMAGKTESVEGADDRLFDGATWCLTPRPSTSDYALQTVLDMVETLGASPFFIDPEEHDSSVAGISHLPFLLSVALTRIAARDPARQELRRLSAGGFRDVSRLALGSPDMYRDICATNPEHIGRWVDSAIEELEHLRDLIADGGQPALDQLRAEFIQARDERAGWMPVGNDRQGRLLETGDEAPSTSAGRQVEHFLFGNLFRRPRRAGRERSTEHDKPKPDRD